MPNGWQREVRLVEQRAEQTQHNNRLNTRQRIVQAALELFNQQGERQVTTNHIAAHLGISPGNLLLPLS